jgi:hypothetical protein
MDEAGINMEEFKDAFQKGKLFASGVAVDMELALSLQRMVMLQSKVTEQTFPRNRKLFGSSVIKNLRRISRSACVCQVSKFSTK